MIINKKLFLFTIQFPYSGGEFFLYNEVKILSQKFETIYIFPLDLANQTIIYKLPHNVKIINFNAFQSYNRIKILIKNIGLITSIYYTELRHSNTKSKYFTQFIKTLNNIIHKIAISDKLNEVLKNINTSNAVAYTYWFNQWTFILTLINLKYQPLNIYTRIHGMDVYEEQHSEKDFFFQFRTFQLKQIKKVFAISLNGKNHLIKQNNLNQNNVSIIRLGTIDFGCKNIFSATTFTIVSCSSLNLHKRVNLIIDVLVNITTPLNWIHFGDGDLLDDVLKKAKLLPNNITFTPMGFKNNEFILNYYQTNNIDLFINVSETEGVPVSIMEAISFGIPTIATNVGGVAEIVNKKTGFLIEKYFNSMKVAKIIECYINASIETKKELRNSTRLFWEENYMANKNYNDLSLQLL